MTRSTPEEPSLPNGGTNDSLTAPRVFREITLRNILSFGRNSAPLELRNLNVFIGPNGSGKSNLLEAIGLLRAAPLDLRPIISNGGGVGEWIWKGATQSVASIDVVVENQQGSKPLRHVIAFRSEGQAFRLDDERIENAKADATTPEPDSYYRFDHGRPVLYKNRHQLPDG